MAPSIVKNGGRAADPLLHLPCQGYRIGCTKGAALLFDPDDGARIRELPSAEGIDPDTDPAA